MEQTKLRQGRGAMTVDSTHNLSHHSPTLLTDGVTNATREHITRQSLAATTNLRRHLTHHRDHGGPEFGEIRENILDNILS